MQKKTILTFLLLAVIGAATYFLWFYPKEKTQENQNLAGSIRFGWIPSGSFSGEVSGMNLFAKKYGLNLKCEAGGPGINTITMVQSGQNTFGTIAADEILAANDKGADLVIIGVINYNSPAGFVSLDKKPLNKPADLMGKSVGFLPFGSLNYLYESMLKKNGVDRSKVKEITVSPDMKPFINGVYDVHPVFVYDEPVHLEDLGLKYYLLEPKNFGVSFKGPCYFCKRETFEKQQELVKAFINTVADGWNYAIKNPHEAIGFLKKFAPEIDEVREEKVLRKGIPYFSAYKGQPINSDLESWKSMVSDCKEFKIIKNDIDIERLVKLDFINSYYKK